ncbi:MAG: hypothetical protein JW737_03525 [Acidobacteria bacterium]|nr:hypothetical protein [Acidobacteriota bacterium]
MKRQVSSYLLCLVLASALFLPAIIWAEKEKASADEVIITSDLSHTTGKLGDRRKLEITVEYPASLKNLGPKAPEWGEEFHIFSMKNTNAPSDKDDVKKALVTVIEFSVFDTGEIKIPPLVYQFRNKDNELIEVSSPKLWVSISSLVADDDSDIKDIKGPLSIQSGGRTVWIIVVFFAAAMMIITGTLFFLRWRKNGNGKKALALDPPHIEAYKALDTLSRQNLLPDGLYKEYYIRISNITRRYIDRRYNIDAFERTTREIKRDIMKEDISREARNRLFELFEEYDLVKFAKFIPTGSKAREALETVYYFVDVTREIPVIDSGENPVEEKHPVPDLSSDNKNIE